MNDHIQVRHFRAVIKYQKLIHGLEELKIGVYWKAVNISRSYKGCIRKEAL
jgi:hypothetical protein